MLSLGYCWPLCPVWDLSCAAGWYMLPTASPINTLLEEGRRWWWACAVLEELFLLYITALHRRNISGSGEREKKGCVCCNSVETLSFYARPCLSEISKPKKRNRASQTLFSSFLSLFVSSAVAVSFLANFSLFS